MAINPEAWDPIERDNAAAMLSKNYSGKFRNPDGSADPLEDSYIREHATNPPGRLNGMTPGEISSHTESGPEPERAGGRVKKKKAGGSIEGAKAKRRADRPGRKAGGWIAGAIKKPGALHEQLGVPQGEKIPTAKINAAAKSSNPTLAKRANLAKTLKKMH